RPCLHHPVTNRPLRRGPAAAAVKAFRLHRSHHPEEVAEQHPHGTARTNTLRKEETVMKTLAVRLDDELHARIGMLSKLSGMTVTDTIRTAIEKHLDTLA